MVPLGCQWSTEGVTVGLDDGDVDGVAAQPDIASRAAAAPTMTVQGTLTTAVPWTRLF